MNMKSIIVVGALALGGCAAQPESFSWYHPDGGEYLFAYDSNACTEIVNAQGLSLGSDIDGPFFECMLGRGYYLVDGESVVRTPPLEAIVAEQQVSQQ